ncbi:MAG: immunoglobulin domain-containing protein [Opitutaceae bacterium]|nr:immunoglobulin domain-containing protein [Verrucomicrobiales bacterium]
MNLIRIGRFRMISLVAAGLLVWLRPGSVCGAGAVDLGVTSTAGPLPARVGNQLRFVVSILNSGTSPATGVILSNDVNVADVVSPNITDGTLGISSPAAGVTRLVANVGVLGPGQAAKLVFFVTVPASGSVNASYSAVAAESESTNTLDNVGSRSVSVAVRPTILDQPLGGVIGIGGQFLFSVDPGPGVFQYQWRRNGVVIPGANQPQYAINIVARPDFGVYTVVVGNSSGAVLSQAAALLPTFPPASGADNFANRQSINGASGTVQGSNSGATSEIGEPNHAGKIGGKSVWFGWNPPQGSGIATFRTRGSGFDTLLAVYSGQSITQLTPVASDDDDGGTATSEVRFQTSGQPFALAIDGFAGGQGTYVLDWTWQSTTDTLPRITGHPQSTTVPPGGPAQLEVTAVGTGLQYQWYFGTTPIAGATGPQLEVNPVKFQNVGSYRVVVARDSGLGVTSRVANVEISTAGESLTEDKFNDLFSISGQQAGMGGTEKKTAFTSVSAGTPGTQTFSTVGSGAESGESNHGGTSGGSSRWFYLKPTTNGIMVIDTIGSTFDTVVTVYRGPSLFSLTLVASDDNGAPDGIRSRVQFNATNNTQYYVAVDGVAGASGTVQLNYVLGNLPAITLSPTNRSVHVGSNATFAAGASGSPAAGYQWRRNGTNLAGATGASLNLSSLTTNDSGYYSMAASNAIGSTATLAAQLMVCPRVQLGAGPGGMICVTNGVLYFTLCGGISNGLVVIDSSTNLSTWTPLTTNLLTGGMIGITDPATNGPLRFFRARELQ